MFKKSKKKIKEVLTVPREDRRILSNVPDPENIRGAADRRGIKDGRVAEEDKDPNYINKMKMLSLRYVADFEVLIIPEDFSKREGLRTTAVDISTTGLLVEMSDNTKIIQVGDTVKMHFDIPAATMPEGFESFVKLEAVAVRIFSEKENGQSKKMIAFEFSKPLTDYFQKKRWGYSVFMASSLLFIAVALVMLMRVESVIYFKYNKVLYFYSLVAATFLLTRYLFGALYREVRINPDFTPGVSIIIPCFNEEEWIHRTILSCMNQDYPIDKFEVIVVDDQSTDGTVEQIEKVVALVHKEAERYLTKERLRVHVLKENGGKRVALVKGVEMAKHDLVVFVDSDSFLEPDAIKNLVPPFQDPKMGGVAGRTDVENKYTNMITKLQTVRYYIAFRIMKAAESYFDSVTCLSGPLSCYRKELIIEHTDAWLNQKFLGQPATFGDDRSMTNFILKTHRTGYQDSAICSTIVPSNMGFFLKQQMRWKRSWLRESLIAGTFIWKKEPFMALFFYVGLIVPIAAPIIVLYNMLYVPIVHNVFPTTFLMGLLLMALLMSVAHLLFRKSKLWIFGFVFCAFYEFILLWQMPVAWVTFWKSTWGTRETPQDIEAKNKKMAKKQKKNPIALESQSMKD
ncbi:glycosyltransferase family 2 protein [Sporosarcina sp. FSL K6-3457]|uniref:glycosyltransferase family 2 protein n=1 Tax=Sporosarcina sp. FSL K6-3457 TaxID=2978204 RepID=UPI0030FA10F6